MIRSRPTWRSVTARFVVLASVSGAGCALPSGEPLLDGSDVAGSIQRELGIPLAKTEPVESTAVLANVRDVYTGRSSNETVTIVDFNSADATVQLTSDRTGSARPEPLHATRDNIVVLYRHEPGTISRFRELRTALDQLGPPGLAAA